jgi:hypothetical protein
MIPNPGPVHLFDVRPAILRGRRTGTCSIYLVRVQSLCF